MNIYCVSATLNVTVLKDSVKWSITRNYLAPTSGDDDKACKYDLDSGRTAPIFQIIDKIKRGEHLLLLLNGPTFPELNNNVQFYIHSNEVSEYWAKLELG